MKTGYIKLILLFVFVSAIASLRVNGEINEKKKSVSKNGEREKEYQEALKALKDKSFLISFYSFIDNAGNIISLEPEGNFITVNKEKFIMQKSVSLVLNTFSGPENFKGGITEFKLKESKKGNIQFSFVINSNEKVLYFKGLMRKGDNAIEGGIKGKKEDREILVSGNVQPLASHFVY